MIYVTSDWHFNHNRDFLYGVRGYTNPYDMNKEIIKLHNSVINYDDDVYFLGDGYLSCTDEEGCACVKQLNGKIHWIIGNHDTDNKIEAISKCWNVVDIAFAARLKYKNYHFFLSHYPTLCGNSGKERRVYNLHGHTHSQDKFELYEFGCYNVGIDAHHCNVVSLDDIIKEINERSF